MRFPIWGVVNVFDLSRGGEEPLDNEALGRKLSDMRFVGTGRQTALGRGGWGGGGGSCYYSPTKRPGASKMPVCRCGILFFCFLFSFLPFFVLSGCELFYSHISFFNR